MPRYVNKPIITWYISEVISRLRALQKMETIRLFLCDGYFLKTASLSQKTQYNTYSLQWAWLAPSYYLTSGSPPPLTPTPPHCWKSLQSLFWTSNHIKVGTNPFLWVWMGGEAVPWQLGKSALHLSPSPWEDPFKVGKGAFMFQRQWYLASTKYINTTDKKLSD